MIPDSSSGPEAVAEERELLLALEAGIATALTAPQRNVLVALAVTGVPIDMLADRRGATRGRCTRRCTTPVASCAGTSATGVSRSWPRAIWKEPGEPEVTCEVCFAQLDVYIDAEVLGAGPDEAVPGMAAHLRGCPACAEEHDSLQALAAAVGP